MIVLTLLFGFASFAFYLLASWFDMMGMRTQLYEYMDASYRSEKFSRVCLILSAVCALGCFFE